MNFRVRRHLQWDTIIIEEGVHVIYLVDGVSWCTIIKHFFINNFIRTIINLFNFLKILIEVLNIFN
jgi:hypothetical protein